MNLVAPFVKLPFDTFSAGFFFDSNASKCYTNLLTQFLVQEFHIVHRLRTRRVLLMLKKKNTSDIKTGVRNDEPAASKSRMNKISTSGLHKHLTFAMSLFGPLHRCAVCFKQEGLPFGVLWRSAMTPKLANAEM